MKKLLKKFSKRQKRLKNGGYFRLEQTKEDLRFNDAEGERKVVEDSANKRCSSLGLNDLA